MINDCSYNIKKNIIIREDGDEAIIFDPESLKTVYVNETALLIFKSLKNNMTQNKILKTVQEEYDHMTTQEVKKHIKEAIDVFLNIQFMEVKHG